MATEMIVDLRSVWGGHGLGPSLLLLSKFISAPLTGICVYLSHFEHLTGPLVDK